MPLTATQTIDEKAMGVRAWIAVIVTIGLNALDGFDVLSISFAANGIAADFQIDRATLGWVLAMELFGMAVGSIFLGGIADKIGRRPTILTCLVAMTIGMYGASQADSINGLLAWRLITGVGIGGMLAAINAAAAEYSNKKWRSVAMAVMVIGYPIGGILGGLVVQQILGAGGEWRDIFVFGAYATAAFIPLVYFFAPETVAYLERKQPKNALQRLNKSLTYFGHAAIDALPTMEDNAAKASILELFTPLLRSKTILVTLAYFVHITTFYYVIKWIPSISAEMGYPGKAAAGVLTWASLGGAVGGAVFGIVAMRIGLKITSIVTLACAFLMICYFGKGSETLAELSGVVAVAMFFANAGVVALYTLFARVFPPEVRATGTGFAIGVGRGGAALAPVVAGYLFQAGFGLQAVSIIMGSGALIAAIAIGLIKIPD